MVRHFRGSEWNSSRDQIIGLSERSFHKSYYPQLRENLDRLERFHALLDRTTDFVILLTLPDAIIVDANGAIARFVGQTLDALIGKPLSDLSLGKTSELLEDRLRDHQAQSDRDPEGTGESFITWLSRNDKDYCLEFSLRVVLLDSCRYGVLLGRDVTERERSHKMVADLLAEKQALLDNALVGIALVRHRQFVSCNRRLEEILGYAPGSLIGASTRVLYPDERAFDGVGQEAYVTINEGRNFEAVMQLTRSDGSLFWGELTGRSIDVAHPAEGSIWVFSDITERKKAEERANYLAYHDSLTGLPNKSLIEDRLQQAIAFAHQTGTKIAFVVIDLDRFKTINDFLGHAGGDRLLIDVARRLIQRVRSTDTLSRQGGDEFHMLMTNLAEPDSTTTYLRELMGTLTQPFLIDGQQITITISAGVAIYPEDGADFETLLKKADMAMYRSKESGRNTYRFFNEEMNNEAVEHLTIYSGLQRGIENQQFVLHYQPQFNIDDGKLVGAEALIRWSHPDLGLVSPSRFIPVAEETGLIVQIGEWVLKEACLEAAKWEKAGYLGIIVAVNLSATQFKQGNIEASVNTALKESGLSPNLLELELTESILIRDSDNVLSTIKRLKQIGVRLSIDDFGTGYSSLAYLKRFDVDKLKIDQAFIRDLQTNVEDTAIVRAIIQMAHGLGLHTIAEGVESKEIVDMLRNYCCDMVQGYHCGRPMPPQSFMAFVNKNPRCSISQNP